MIPLLLWAGALLTYAGYAVLAAVTTLAAEPWVASLFVIVSVSMWLLLRRLHGKG